MANGCRSLAAWQQWQAVIKVNNGGGSGGNGGMARVSKST